MLDAALRPVELGDQLKSAAAVECDQPLGRDPDYKPLDNLAALSVTAQNPISPLGNSAIRSSVESRSATDRTGSCVLARASPDTRFEDREMKNRQLPFLI